MPHTCYGGQWACWCLPVRAVLYWVSFTSTKSIEFVWHEDEQLSRFQRGVGPAPVTVATKDPTTEERYLPLDEAIAISLQHSEVIRVLAGVTATSTGRTIYDTAIATTPIDQAVARFDRCFSANSSFRRNEGPFSVPDPGDPLGALIVDRRLGGTDLSAGVNQTNRLGGVAGLNALDRWNNSEHGLPGSGTLDPAHNLALELSYTQPLLAGAGRSVNEAPIVIAGCSRISRTFSSRTACRTWFAV